MTALLELQDVEARYGPVHVLHGISLAVQEGSIVAVLGPNGAGKTTTLRCLYTLMRPDRGSVLVDAIDAAVDRHRAACRRDQSRQHPQRRRLAGAVRPEQRDDLAAPDLERHVVDDRAQPESPREPGGGDHRGTDGGLTPVRTRV